MITIKLNGKKHKVKTTDELTVKEYIKLSKYERIDIAKYLHVVLNISEKAILNYSLKNIAKFSDYIGEVKDISKVKRPLKITISGKEYSTKRLKVDKVGHRTLFENEMKTNSDNWIDKGLFLLSMLLVGEFDRDKIIIFKWKLYEANYIDVLTNALFFLTIFQNGYKPGLHILSRLKAFILIKTKQKRKRQGFII